MKRSRLINGDGIYKYEFKENEIDVEKLEEMPSDLSNVITITTLSPIKIKPFYLEGSDPSNVRFCRVEEDGVV